MCGEYCSADSITVDFLIPQNCVAEVDWESNRVDKQYKLEYWHVGRAGKDALKMLTGLSKECVKADSNIIQQRTADLLLV